MIGRRDFLRGAGTAAATLPLAAASASAASPENPRKRPNILIIQPDQHAYQIMGCAGNHQALTPNLDALAGESVFFENSVANSPVCTPSRASMQTGLYWHTHGLPNNNIRLNPGLPCLAEVLAADGYSTGYIGKWHLDGGLPPIQPGGQIPPGPRRQGWKEWWGYQKSHEFFEVWRHDDEGRRERLTGYDWEPTWHTDMALDFIERHEADNDPWCFYLGYGPPHKPEQCPQKFLDLYDPAAFELTPAQQANYDDEDRLREELQLYYGQVSAVDHEVGRMMEGLKKLGADRDTIVVYWSDHGDVLGCDGRLRGKSAPLAMSFRVPGMIRWPGELKPQRSQAMLNTPDIPATLLDLAGSDIPVSWQGVSLAPHCRGQQQDNLPTLAPLGLEGWDGVWDGRYVYAEGRYDCLYDHQNDPHELNNLIGDRHLVAQMQAKMREAMLATGHPEYAGSRG